MLFLNDLKGPADPNESVGPLGGDVLFGPFSGLFTGIVASATLAVFERLRILMRKKKEQENEFMLKFR